MITVNNEKKGQQPTRMFGRCPVFIAVTQSGSCGQLHAVFFPLLI